MKRREFLLAGGLGLAGLATTAKAEEPKHWLPALAGAREEYSFVIIADPQLGHADDTSRVFANARKTLMQAVAEVNAMAPQPAFVVFLGDLVNVFNEKSVANFEECVRDLKAPKVIVHGNHDTHAPFTEFRALMQRHCGFDDLFYSFDAGPWHYVVLPCNLDGHNDAEREVEAAMLAWLETDLDANAAKPTVIFEHLHTLPIGLAQTEWYTFPLPLRKRLMDLYARHGNVRWYFNGHVHNGFEASFKTSWNYRGINFVNCPTIIEMRNFGEERPGFEKGIDEAGYYLVARVDQQKIKLTGRRAGQRDEFLYTQEFRAFEDAMEPRWWKPIGAWPGKTQVENGSFEKGLAGWERTYRYPADHEPGSEVAITDGGVSILTRSKISHFWANDEYTELYQVVKMPGSRPVLEAAYSIAHAPVSGGGYVRAMGLAGTEARFLMMWHWGEQENKADYLPRCFAYAVDGQSAGWSYLNDLAAAKRGMFWKLPAAPGSYAIEADMASLFDAATNDEGAFAKLGVDRLLVALGTWANKDDAALSGAVFTRIALLDGGADARESVYTADNDRNWLTSDESVFSIEFAADLNVKQQRQRAKKMPA